MDRWTLVVFLIFTASFSWADSFCQSDQKIPSMGAVFEIQISTDCHRALGEGIYLAIKKQLDEWESTFSLYQPASELSFINKKGESMDPSSLMLELLNLAKHHYVKTHGKFDVAVGAVLSRIEKSFNDYGKPPAKGDSVFATADDIQIRNQKIRFLKPKMQITLDGLVKGFAVDRISEYLEKHRFHNYLVNFSGNMRWSGFRSPQQYWKISRWDSVKNKAIALPIVRAGAVASSGKDHRYYDAEKKWHHLIDPKKNASAGYWSNVTVTGSSAMICDILSTAVFVSSTADFTKFLKENYSGYKAYAL